MPTKAAGSLLSFLPVYIDFSLNGVQFLGLIQKIIAYFYNFLISTSSAEMVVCALFFLSVAYAFISFKKLLLQADIHYLSCSITR